MSKSVAYTTITFRRDSCLDILVWREENIPTEFLYYSRDSWKYTNGFVEHLHLTVFYGLDSNRLSFEDESNMIKDIIIPESLEISSIGTFDIDENICCLYLGIADEDSHKLQKVRSQVLVYPHDDKYLSQNFIPHISLAFLNRSKPGFDNFLDILQKKDNYPRKIFTEKLNLIRKS